MTLRYYLVKKIGPNISNVRGFRSFTIISGYNSQLRVYGDDLMVDPSKIFFRMVYRIAVQNLALLSSRSASFQKLGLICPAEDPSPHGSEPPPPTVNTILQIAGKSATSLTYSHKNGEEMHQTTNSTLFPPPPPIHCCCQHIQINYHNNAYNSYRSKCYNKIDFSLAPKRGGHLIPMLQITLVGNV